MNVPIENGSDSVFRYTGWTWHAYIHHGDDAAVYCAILVIVQDGERRHTVLKISCIT